MYDKKIFSVDGAFRFGHIVIDSADIYFGTVAMRIVDALIRRAKRIAEFFVTLEQEGPDWVLMYLERPSFQFEEEWFLTNVDQHEYGPYPSQACAHDAGLLLLDDAKDMYREIPKAECRAEIGYRIGCFRIAREYGLIAPDDPTPIFSQSEI